MQHLDNKRQTDERVNTVNQLLLSDFLIVCVKGHPGHASPASRRAYNVSDDDTVGWPANMWCGRRLVDRRYPRIYCCEIFELFCKLLFSYFLQKKNLAEKLLLSICGFCLILFFLMKIQQQCWLGQ